MSFQVEIVANVEKGGVLKILDKSPNSSWLGVGLPSTASSSKNLWMSNISWNESPFPSIP